MEISDILHRNSIVFEEDNMVCLRISSKNEDACEKVFEIIVQLFSNSNWLYKFISFSEDLKLKIQYCKAETLRFFKEKSVLYLFTRAYPELHGEIDKATDLYEILRNWSNAVYQTQVIYIARPENVENIYSTFKKDLYKDSDSIFSVWPNIDIAVRNHPEAEDNNTFLLYLHKQYLLPIKNILNTGDGDLYCAEHDLT